MKGMVVLLVACCLIGKISAQSKTPDSLLELKNLLESQLSGTAIRDIAVDFELKRDAVSHNYKLAGRILELVEPAPMEALLQKIGKLYSSTDTTTYTGTVYFDRYTDRAIVGVHPLTEDRFFIACLVCRIQPVA